MKREKGYSQVKNKAKQARKRKEAEARQAKYDSLTIAEKFATLIEGGSKKQRTKLEKLKEKSEKKKATWVDERNSEANSTTNENWTS